MRDRRAGKLVRIRRSGFNGPLSGGATLVSGFLMSGVLTSLLLVGAARPVLAETRESQVTSPLGTVSLTMQSPQRFTEAKCLFIPLDVEWQRRADVTVVGELTVRKPGTSIANADSFLLAPNEPVAGNYTDYVYVWADGIHLKVRLTQDKVCLLVMIGVRPDGKKELIALADGHRESTESWADLLSSCKRRGMVAPVLAAGDGALGFWAALRDVFPDTKEQRCWFHKIANVLNCLPKSAQPGAKAALAEIWQAEDKEHAIKAVKAFEAAYGAKWPKATAKITDDVDVLLTFYDYPAEHWIHLRTTNPIESTFATVRLRQRVTKGPGSRAAGIAMAFKLIQSAQGRWRAVNAPHLVPLVRAGATFEKGKLVERDAQIDHEEEAA